MYHHTKEACENCRFYSQSVCPEEGECFRFPHRELMGAGDWCGEWKPILDDPPVTAHVDCGPAIVQATETAEESLEMEPPNLPFWVIKAARKCFTRTQIAEAILEAYNAGGRDEREEHSDERREQAYKAGVQDEKETLKKAFQKAIKEADEAIKAKNDQ